MPRQRPTPAKTAPPMDVRLMNATASVLFVVAALALLGFGLAWLARLPAFTLQAVRIEGDVGRNSAATIRANALPKLAGNFFTLDLERAQAAFQSVPWVRRAVVSRRWPDRLAVQLEEHRVAAWWHRENGDDKLVNLQGEVFEANPGDVEDEGLPTLAGPDERQAPAMLALLRRLEPVFAPLEARVETLSLSARGSWRLALDSGAEIELGRGSDDEVVARSQAFVGTVGEVTQRFSRPLASADLRHADGYAVKLRGVGTVESLPKKKSN